MNTCMVCGGVIPEHAGNCPYCGEYAIQVIGTCNDEAMRRLEQKAAAKRRKLLEGIAVQMVTLEWKEDALEEHTVEVGTAEELYHKEKWLDLSFAPAYQLKELEMKSVIVRGGQQKQLQLCVPVPAGSGELRAGAVLDDGFQLHILLKSENGAVTRSEPVELLKL